MSADNFLMQKLLELSDKIADIHTTQAVQGEQNKNAFNEVKNDISDVKEDISTMSEKIESMSTRLEALEQKKSFFSDMREIAIPFAKAVAGSKIVIIGVSVLLMAVAFHYADRIGIDIAKIPTVVIPRQIESDDQVIKDSIQ